MKKYILTLSLTYLLVLPLIVLGQKENSKDINNLRKLGVNIDSNLHLSYSQSNRIIAIWDSVYEIGRKQQINNVLSDKAWEQILLQEINWASSKQQVTLNARLQFYLAQVYHSQKLFSKSIPIQEKLIASKQYLTANQFQKTLTRLEKAYVQTNNLYKALAIRKQRLKMGFIESSYELYTDFELYDLALQEYLAFEKITPKTKMVDQYKHYRVLGNLYLELGKMDSARKYYSIGLNLSNQQLQNSNENTPKNIHQGGRASFMGLLGRCFLAEGDYPSAIKYLSIDIEQSEDDKLNKIFKMIHLTNAYIANRDALNAKKYVRQIDQLIKDKEDKRMTIRASEMKSNYFTLTKQLDSALFYTKQYNTLKEAQNEIIRKNQAILLLSNLEAEDRRKDLVIINPNLEKERADKKVQQILLWASVIVILMAVISLIILMLSNLQKSKSKELIEKKNNENELLLKELHHRVKNNLQVIYSLINLQKRRIDSPELHQSLSMVQNRIKTMSLVHQNLHENENFKEVNLEAYVKTIADYLKLLYLNEDKEISIQLSVDESIELIMDRAITIGLLINEIMSNSMKYAFKGRKKGNISIDVQKIHNGFQMKISDDGIGFSMDQVNSKSLGMYLIENLVKQIQGKYELEQNEGTTYIIYFNA
ncbi:MAG: tetratricopeptide repeat-containing sensor histidine kinase [Sediminibacterium sp.]